MGETEATGLVELLPYLVTLLGSSHPIVQVLMLLSTLVGGASALTKIITIITRITPNTKDDVFASKMAKGVSKVVGVLDKLALNPTDQEARRK
ncbi:hypothetical protein RBG11_004244 [Vibrio parahaemolyticus]|nr:hypothetical protein [Vibrio parahaemolyticus]